MYKSRKQKGFYIPPSVLGLRQEGGELVDDGMAMAEEGMGGDPMAQMDEIVAMMRQAAEMQDCEMAFQSISAFLALLPDEGGAMEEPPMEEGMGDEMMGDPMMADPMMG